MDIPVLYINLDKRTDRRKHIQNVLKDFTNIERVEAIDTCATIGGAYGCILSHIKALNIAKEKGYPFVMICEDDFEWISKDKFKIPDMHFDVCMIEGDIVDKSRIDDNYNRVVKGLHTGCYIVKQHYYDTLLNCFTESYDKLKQNYVKDNFLDVYWEVLQKKDNFIAPRIMIGRQREDYSDIQKKNMKRF